MTRLAYTFKIDTLFKRSREFAPVLPTGGKYSDLPREVTRHTPLIRH